MKIIIFKLYKLIGLPIDILRYYGLFPFVFSLLSTNTRKKNLDLSSVKFSILNFKVNFVI